jgi:hypothetical protein
MLTIFEFCLPGFATFQPLPSNKFNMDLCSFLSLRAICSYWREIAWSMPSLWSLLMVCVDPSKPDSHISLVQEWLAHSGELPLSIHIYSNLDEPSPENWHRAVFALADVINQCSNRWSNLDLCVPLWFYQRFHGTTSILQSIGICSLNLYNVLNFQLTCPCLERAHLSSF